MHPTCVERECIWDINKREVRYRIRGPDGWGLSHETIYPPQPTLWPHLFLWFLSRIWIFSFGVQIVILVIFVLGEIFSPWTPRKLLFQSGLENTQITEFQQVTIKLNTNIVSALKEEWNTDEIQMKYRLNKQWSSIEWSEKKMLFFRICNSLKNPQQWQLVRVFFRIVSQINYRNYRAQKWFNCIRTQWIHQHISERFDYQQSGVRTT